MDSAKQLEHLFSQARTQTVFASCDEVKEQFQHASALGTAGAKSKIVQFLLTYKWIIMLVTISTAIVLMTTLPSSPSQNTGETALLIMDVSQTKEKENNVQKRDEEKKVVPAKAHLEVRQESQPDVVNSLNDQEEREEILVVKKEIVAPERKEILEEKVVRESPRPYFPTLTKKEIAENNKRKKKMMKKVATFNHKVYAYIGSGSFVYENDSVSVQAFFMQKGEVTNIQYKTFLFDLLIQGKKDEFQIAKPEQQLWTELLGDEYKEMQDNYFSGEEWEDYPVVNVSREGALLYCKWLTEERRSFAYTEMETDFRLPTKVEWTMAASADGKMMPYPWSGESTQNEEGCYLANFDAPNSVVATKGSCDLQSDGAPVIASTMTYNPNEFGLYNMSGNVAEMVQIKPGNDDRGEAGTAGGGWMNSAEEIKINAPDPYKGRTEGHPNIGFRVVITHIGSHL